MNPDTSPTGDDSIISRTSPTAPTSPVSASLSPPSSVHDPAKPDVAQTVQAAQLSDKTPTIDAPAGGNDSPTPPAEPQNKGSATAGNRRRKKKSNQFDFRADEDTADRIYNRVDIAGCRPSEAIRQLIEDGDTRCARVILTPKTPPEQLEEFIGALKGWRHDFQSVRSRLNAPMPLNSNDIELTEQVRKWRATAEELHQKIMELLSSALATHRVLTRLTPQKVSLLRKNYPHVFRAAKNCEEKAAKAEKSSEKATFASMSETYRIIAELIEDMGILEK